MSARARLRGYFTNAFLADGTRRFVRRMHRASRVLRRAPRTVVFYARVDDPRSYLVGQVLATLVDAYGLVPELVLVPTPALDVDPEPELRARFEREDSRRLADRFALDFPEPGVEPVATRVRLANAILLTQRSGREALALFSTVSRALLTRDGEGLAALAAEHGATPGQDVRPRLEANYERLRQGGQYESGVVAFEGELYDGVDRLHYLESRLRDEGLGQGPLLAPRLESGPPSPVMLDVPRVPVDVWFSFRSPFSYLAIERLAAWPERYPVELRLRPVLPMVMRGLPVPEVKRLYIARDAKREADRQGIPFGRICDPVGPGVERCLAVFLAAEREGKGLAFAQAAMRGIWSEALEVATDAGLFEVARRAGLDATTVRAALEDPTSFRDLADLNREELYELGFWGVPVVRLGDFATWGQDRLPLIEAQLLAKIAHASA